MNYSQVSMFLMQLTVISSARWAAKHGLYKVIHVDRYKFTIG